MTEAVAETFVQLQRQTTPGARQLVLHQDIYGYIRATQAPSQVKGIGEWNGNWG